MTQTTEIYTDRSDPEVDPSELWDRNRWREECKSIFFLCAVVLSTVFEDKFQDLGVIHKYLCDFLDVSKNGSQRKFISIFRGSFKTTILLGYVIYLYVWALVNRKPVTICYNTATAENAESFMADFREILDECVLLKWIFPEIGNPKTDYRRNTLKKVEYRWVKFHVASLDTKQVSRHYTVIINDDLVNDDNAFSDTERKKILRQWKFQKSIITKYKKFKIGLELEVGTPYHHLDLISHISKQPSYSKFIVPEALPDDQGRLDIHKGLGIITFPEMYCWEDFQEKFGDQGASIYASQYQLKCIDESDVLCKQEWIRYWRFLPEVYRRYIVIDPAGTEDSHNCPTGIVIFDVNESGTIFVLSAMEIWVTPLQLIRTMEALKEEYDPDEIYVEKEKYSITIMDTYEHLAPMLNFDLVNPKNRTKEGRIMRLKQWFETGRILLAQGMNTFETRLVTYPDADYDDMLDAFSYGLDVMIPPKRKIKRPERETAVADGFEDEIRRIKAMYPVHKQEVNYDHFF